MRDVAELAGYSSQTVSRVLSGQPNIRASTRTRVLAAVQELGYRLNPAARTLVTGRTRTLGVVYLSGVAYGTTATLHGIEEAARSAGYWVAAASAQVSDSSSLRRALERLAEQAVMGIVMVAPLISARETLGNLPRDIPVVAVEGDSDYYSGLVRVDQVTGGRLATEHLLAAGHSTVWHVAGPSDRLDARDRAAGWRGALTRAGAEVTEPLIGDWTAASGYRAGQLLARMPEVTAAFVANDQMAMGVYRALHEYGRTVPGDVSIVGFDDIPEAGYFQPPLTTIRQNFDELGARSVRVLLDQIGGGDGDGDGGEDGGRGRGSGGGLREVILAPQLIPRKSTAPPSGR